MGNARDKRCDRGADRCSAARALACPGGGLAVGAVADLCVIDPERPLTIPPTSWRQVE